MNEDLQTCTTDFRKSYTRTPGPVTVPGANVAGIAGAAFAVGIMQGIAEGKARTRFVGSCMRGKGWLMLDLTDDESKQVVGLKTDDAKKAWADAFMAGDIRERLEAASAPRVAPLPHDPLKPFEVGGVRLSLDELTVAPSVVGKGQALLTGTAHHRRTATLAEPFTTTHLPRLQADVGTVFHEVDFQVEEASDSDRSSMWCGPTTSHALLATDKNTTCFLSTFEGYATDFLPGSQPWLGGVSQSWSQPDLLHSGVVVLTPSETDLLGPMPLTLRLDRLDDKAAQVSAVASRDGKDVVFWRTALPFDPSGQAVLPFWTHRLLLTRSGVGVEARLTADGDGKGWLELPAPEKG